MSHKLIPESEAVSVQTVKDDTNAPHQLIYADQVVSVAVGPFVSRVTLGLENHNTVSRVAVVTLVMPTNGLHQLAAQLSATLSGEEAQRIVEIGYKEYLEAVKNQ